LEIEFLFHVRALIFEIFIVHHQDYPYLISRNPYISEFTLFHISDFFNTGEMHLFVFWGIRKAGGQINRVPDSSHSV
jgi:hypothetical protein